jgi:hypothetical protein
MSEPVNPNPDSPNKKPKFQSPIEIPPAAGWLGSAGVLPFLGLLLIALFANRAEQRQLGLQAFAGYSAVILSFLGGVRWGAALAFPNPRMLLLAIGPSFLAFLSLLLKPAQAVAVLALLMVVVAFGDWARLSNPLWPDWYKRLRIRLTVAVVVLHLVLLIGIRA